MDGLNLVYVVCSNQAERGGHIALVEPHTQ